MGIGRAEQVAEYLKRERKARENAERATDGGEKAMWLDIAEQWARVAKTTADGPKFDFD